MTEQASQTFPGVVELRDVVETDLDRFFTHQLDPEASQLIGFAPRDKADFDAHWAKVLSDDEIIKQTILAGGEIAGHIVCFFQSGEREVGYWLGREYWGRGIATKALTAFLIHVAEGPLFAHVAKHNHASFRVLEKCGFDVAGEDRMLSEVTGDVIEEWVMRLDE
jgi:RimJ/RimL family protein N-acetyltransferase